MGESDLEKSNKTENEVKQGNNNKVKNISEIQENAKKVISNKSENDKFEEKKKLNKNIPESQKGSRHDIIEKDEKLDDEHNEVEVVVENDVLQNNQLNTPKNNISDGKLLDTRVKGISKEKELLLLKEKKKQQEKKDKNKIRYLTEEEIDLAFKWFTNGKQIISSNDIKDCFETFFSNLSKNDKRYYIVGGIKNDTRHLVNIKEEKSQSEMFNSTQTISSLKKMLLKYPFKIKDYDNAFSILCDGGQEDTLSENTLKKYFEIFKDNEIPVKNDVDNVFKCFDRDKDGQLGAQDLFKMKLSDLKKITDDYT